MLMAKQDYENNSSIFKRAATSLVDDNAEVPPDAMEILSLYPINETFREETHAEYSASDVLVYVLVSLHDLKELNVILPGIEDGSHQNPDFQFIASKSLTINHAPGVSISINVKPEYGLDIEDNIPLLKQKCVKGPSVFCLQGGCGLTGCKDWEEKFGLLASTSNITSLALEHRGMMIDPPDDVGPLVKVPKQLEHLRLSLQTQPEWPILRVTLVQHAKSLKSLDLDIRGSKDMQVPSLLAKVTSLGSKK